MLLVNLSLSQAAPQENALNQKCELVQWNLPVCGIWPVKSVGRQIQLDFLKLKYTKPWLLFNQYLTCID